MFLKLRELVKEYYKKWYLNIDWEVAAVNDFIKIVLDDSLGVIDIDVFTNEYWITQEFVDFSKKFTNDDIAKINKSEKHIIDLLNHVINCKIIEKYVFDNQVKLC